MTRTQASELGRALLAWSEGKDIEVRDVTRDTTHWFPFDPESYETIKVDEALQWRVAPSSVSVR